MVSADENRQRPSTDSRFWAWYGLPVVLAVIVAGCGGQSPGPAPVPTPAPIPAPAPAPVPDPCVVDPASCTPPPAAGVQVYFAWRAHWDQTVTAYRVYYGPSLDSVAPLRDVAAPQTETVFDALNDLHAAAGAQLCFRLAAVNADGESPMTDGVCVTLDQIVATVQANAWKCGTGLAGTDLSDTCRHSPNPSMGALEAVS